MIVSLSKAGRLYPMEVVSIDDPSIVTLRSEYGTTLKIGRLAVVKVETR